MGTKEAGRIKTRRIYRNEDGGEKRAKSRVYKGARRCREGERKTGYPDNNP